MNSGVIEISAEMGKLVAQKGAILNDPTIWKMSAEELNAFAARNKRLRELCREWAEVGT